MQPTRTLKMDRISKLPRGIIETILCLLPIQEAARTSILAREWRYHWTKIPKLAFDEYSIPTYGAEPSVLEKMFNCPSVRKVMTRRCKFFYAIDQVLLMHEGPIHEFKLSVQAPSCVEIDHIIRHLSLKNTVKILILYLYETYPLPSSFFSLHQLTDLYLRDCVLDRQPSSFVFSSLTTLSLDNVQISQKALLRLLSSCPLLKRLTIHFGPETIDDSEQIIADLIKCVPGIEHLTVFYLFQHMCYYPPPKELPTKLVHLKYLYMNWITFECKYAVPFLVLLIRSCPNLEKLKLEIDSDDDIYEESEAGSFSHEAYPDVMLEHLTELEILQFNGANNELDFVKFILARSPVLKKAIIFLSGQIDKDRKLQISKILLSSPCASPAVKLGVS